MPYYTRSFLSHHLAHPLNPSISISPFYPLTGMISGAVAGLVCITPASGYVDMTGAFFIGFFGGPLCYAGAQLKHMLGYDDALDAFGVHAIGGIVGGIATGFFASPYIIANGGDINAVGARGVSVYNGTNLPLLSVL